MVEDQAPSDLDQLLARLVDGDATTADIAALELLLDGNPEAQRRYVHYLDLHQELIARDRLGVSPHSQDQIFSEIYCDGNRLRVNRIKVGVVAALAAVLLIALGLGIGRWTYPTIGDGDFAIQGDDISGHDLDIEESDDGVAVLTRVLDVEWLTVNPPQAGNILSPGELKLANGLIQVEFYNGVQLLVEGPADLDIRSVASVICREGRLRSIVPPNATGFSVMTPRFELVDLGTEFGVDVASDGQADVHVFDGEVELYLADGKREPSKKEVLLGGDAMEWSVDGKKTTRVAVPESFTSFEAIRDREKSASAKRFGKWQKLNKQIQKDPRVVARYDFEGDESTLVDSSESKFHGTIVGCEWSSGRWQDKRALEFKRPGDRVRVDIPGEFDSLTIAAWVRIDALPSRFQSLLLTDGFKVGHMHWQVGPQGDLRISNREPLRVRRKFRYISPPVFGPRKLGVWNFVCSTYDRPTQMVTHWFNGRRVFSKPLDVDQSIHVGPAEIGNWGVPGVAARRVIRNFVGRMDELTIWKVALNKDEIEELYNSSRP